MATFKVGQRVRIRRDTVVTSPHQKKFVGCETRTVSRVEPPCPGWGDEWWEVELRHSDGILVRASAYVLEPLTDPRAESFIADMNRFAHVASTTPKVLTPSELDKVSGGAR